MNETKKVVLLEATLREILRLKRLAESSPTAISFDDIFDGGREEREWKRILKRAESLI